MRPSRIQAVEHVDLQARLGTEEELRWFYGELAGLEELCSNDADFPRLRFKSEHIEIRLRMWPDLEIDPIPCRVTILVPVLAELCEALTERSGDYESVSGIAWTDRKIQALDPAGNRIVFKQASRQTLF